MRTKTAVAALLLGALVYSQGLGYELIDRMLGIGTHQNDPQSCPSCETNCLTGTCQGVAKSYVPDPTRRPDTSRCLPVSYLDAVSQPVAFGATPFQTVACESGTCGTPACEPACGPVCSEPCYTPGCRPFTPVQDLFAGLQTLCATARCSLAPGSCVAMDCGPVRYEPAACGPTACDPQASDPPACGPRACDPPACTAPACGPVTCGPIVADPYCRPRPLLGLLNQLSCAVSCGLAMFKPCCGDPCGVPVSYDCGGCSTGASPVSPEPMPAPSTRPAPRPTAAPDEDSAVQDLFPREFDPAVYYRKTGYPKSSPQSNGW